MEDMTQYLVKLSKDIARRHKSTGESLDSLIVKTASAENLPEQGRTELIGWANKSYIDTFGSYEFDNATPEGVAAIVYSDPSNNVSVIPYSYPEYNKAGNGGGRTKSASLARQEKKIDFSNNIREKVNYDLKDLKTKFAHMTQELSGLFTNIAGNIDVLKTIGVSSSELRAQVNHPVITKLYSESVKTKSAFVNPENYAIDKYIQSLKTDTKQLTKVASEYKDVSDAIKVKEAQLRKVNKLGKIFL